MARIRVALTLALLALALAVGAASAQAPLRFTSADAALADGVPRRVTFRAEAASDAGEIVEARLFIAPQGAGARISEPIEIEPAATQSLEFEWQMQQNFIPPGVSIEYFWRVTDSAGNTLESEPARLRPLDPRFDWQGIEDDRLAVFWYDGGEGWGQQMFQTGLEALDVLSEELGTEITRQITLVVYRTQRDFQGAFPPQQEWIGGQAFPNFGTTVQIIQAGDQDWMRTVIFHELSHLVFDQAMEGSLASPPNWLEEGLAMYNEPDGRGSEERVRAAAEAGELLPLSSLQGNFGADGRQVGLAYAQSEMMVTYLLESCGEDGFKAIIDGLVDDQSIDQSLEAACNLDSETLYNEWRATLPGAPDAAPVTEPLSGPVEQPAPVESGIPAWLLLFMGGGACLVALLALAMVFVVLRFQRAPRPESIWRE